MKREDAAARYVRWVDKQVSDGGRGDSLNTLDADPAGVFWLGRLAPMEAAADTHRENRMDPCAMGLRIRPLSKGPWSFTVSVKMCGWVCVETDKWEKLPYVDITLPVDVNEGDKGRGCGAQWITERLRTSGAPGLAAEIRVTDESWRSGVPEIVIELVNTSAPARPRGAGYLFEASMCVSGIETTPFILESLPESFRYDRRMPALGINCGVVAIQDGSFRTEDTVVVERARPEYAFDGTAAANLDLRFQTLLADPIPALTRMVNAYTEWGRAAWSDAVLAERAATDGWAPEMLVQAHSARRDHIQELERLRAGAEVLATDSTLLRAFTLMNEAMALAGRGRYERWRPFQIGFIVSMLPSLVEDSPDWTVVDTIWFATGGGKTEVYLGLLVLAAFFDRLRGKRSGITAWSRFPLRLLSLQQTQRFANALGAAELVRREHRVDGDPIALGYFIGASSTPNAIPKAPTEYNPIDVDDPAMPKRFQVLTSCMFCGSEKIRMKFSRANWTLRHLCDEEGCPSGGEALPFYVVDEEIYRFLPTVVIGTLDKAALIAMQGNMRAFVDGPAAKCDRPGHGFTYARRSTKPTGCLVPDCKAEITAIPSRARARFAPSYRLQDELHLLRDSLGAVDSHYESLLDFLQLELTGNSSKIIASSATLTGYERQAEVLYRRGGRVFPQPGPSAGDSFWSRETPDLLRRFVAVWPRGVTLEWVSDRTTTIVQQSVRRLISDPIETCAEIGVDPTWADTLTDLYGTNVVYGTTVRDVEAAHRSMGTQVPVNPLNVVRLTGQSAFEEVKEALDRLLHPEQDFGERIHAVTASSMMSHGVDVDRLNIMTVLGVPLTTAEFIQATARVGRAHPGLVYVVHKVGRERDATVFAHFEPFIRQGDRFVEPIPVTRSSRRVLELTIPAAVEARRLFVHEPKSPGARLTTVDLLRRYAAMGSFTSEEEARACAAALGIEKGSHLAYQDVLDAIAVYFTRLDDRGSGARWPSDLLSRRPMLSLRDVEASIPVSDD